MACLAISAAVVQPAVAQTLADVTGKDRPLPTAGALFGSVELRSETLKGLPQWTRVINIMGSEQAAFDGCAQDVTLCTSPILKHWRKILHSGAGLGRMEQIRAVNDFFNRWPYKEDRELYGTSEYWATPREFMTRSGDCEDYSIAKYFALRQLGFSKDDLRIVILMDEIRGIGHAVLAIYVENDILILDSLSNLILTHTRYRHYVPQYSMNETTRWAHVGGFTKKKRTAYQGLVARKQK